MRIEAHLQDYPCVMPWTAMVLGVGMNEIQACLINGPLWPLKWGKMMGQPLRPEFWALFRRRVEEIEWRASCWKSLGYVVFVGSWEKMDVSMHVIDITIEKKRVQNVKKILLVKEWKRNRNNQTVTIFNSEMISLLFLFGASTISLHLGYQSNTLVKHSDTSWMLWSKRSGCKQWLSFYHITDWIK